MNQHYDWDTWLKQYNALLLERLNRSELLYYPPKVVEAVKGGWLGEEAATEADVQALEARLGLRLPPSYRQFLLTSNGFVQAGMLVPRLYSCTEVGLFREIETYAYDEWTKYPAPSQTDIGKEQDLPDFFVHFLPSLIIVSESEVAGTARYLLNPARKTQNGEWEAYYYAHWVPGANRYASFWELMQREFAFLRDYVD
jgi:hypothetical protein